MHADHCSLLNGELCDHIATTYGINRDSILNSLAFFHVTKVPAIMQDCLERCLPYEVKELMKHLILPRKISLPETNGLIRAFPFQGSCGGTATTGRERRRRSTKRLKMRSRKRTRNIRIHY